jgi:hypothetical protein
MVDVPRIDVADVEHERTENDDGDERPETDDEDENPVDSERWSFSMMCWLGE